MKKEVKTINNSNKDVLAKLMATENITVLHKKVPTAYFDVKSRTLVCPIFKDKMSPELTDLFMGHEVGHALNTPAEGWHDKVSEKGMIFKGYLNVIEDVRIEKKIKDKYPGLRKSFYAGYKDLANRDFFGLRGKDIQEMNLIDRINIHYKIGSVANIQFSDDEQVFINKCDKLKTWDQVVELAEELFDRQNDLNEKELESMSDLDIEDLMEELGIGDEEGESDALVIEDSEDSDSDESSSSNDGTPSPSEEDVESSDSDSDEEGEEEGEEESKSSKDGSEADTGNENSSKSPRDQLLDEMNKSESDQAFREKESELYNDDEWEQEPSYYEIPTSMKYNNFIVGYKDIEKQMATEELDRSKISKTVKDFQDSNKKIINYMIKEFEMKKAAADYKRSWSAKSGELDMDKLHFYQLKDDIFNRVQVTPDGKNHGVVMLLDWSGSMSGTVFNTIEQATLLSMFCRRLSIPFRLYAFSDSYNTRSLLPEELLKRYNASEYGSDEHRQVEEEIRDFHKTRLFGKTVDTDLNVGSLSLLEIYTDQMNKMEFTTAMENWFQLGKSIDWDYNDSSSWDIDFRIPSGFHLGGTPLDHSLVVMRDYLKDFKRDHGLDITTLVTLTDGSSHSCLHGKANLVDRKINRVFKMHNGRTTHSLLEWIKETVGCNTVGFYISNDKATNIIFSAGNFCGTNADYFGDEYDRHRKEFLNLSTSFTDGCYDLAILINQKKLKLNYNEDELNVESGAGKGVLKRALVKAGSNKMKQRVILNQFVGQMAV